MSKQQTIKEVYDFLKFLENSIGEVLTEYHWRDICGLQMAILQDFPELSAELLTKVDVSDCNVKLGMNKTIIANIDYIVGHLRYGHFELNLTDEEYLKFISLSKEEQENWVRDGELIIDDYRVDDYGDITSIEY